MARAEGADSHIEAISRLGPANLDGPKGRIDPVEVESCKVVPGGVDRELARRRIG